MGIFRRIFGRRKTSSTGPPDGAEAADSGQPLSETTQFILEAVRTKVWSGFCLPLDVHQVIDDLLEEGADEALVRAAVGPEFERKAAAETTWPSTTDCDRLDQVFEDMETRGIIALQNAGYTMSDGLEDVSDALQKRRKKATQGYCFYHFQDVEGAMAGRGLWLAFGVFSDDQAAKAELGRVIKGVLEGHGFLVEWSGDPETRLRIPDLDWKRRSPI